MTTASQYTRGTRPVPRMSSRHFWFIADAIADEVANARSIIPDTPVHEAERQGRLDALANLAELVANRLPASNPLFRRDQFLGACCVPTNA